MTTPREDAATPPLEQENGKEAKADATASGKPATIAVDDVDYDEENYAVKGEIKSTRSEQDRKDSRTLFESVFKAEQDEKTAFTSMTNETARQLVKHIKSMIKDPKSVVPNAGVYALCFALVSNDVANDTRADIYKFIIEDVAGGVIHQPTLFQNGILRRLFCYVLRLRAWDKWTNACLHAINTFLADDQSPIAFALTYGSLLEVLSLMYHVKDTAKIKDKAIMKEFMLQVEFAQGLLEPLAPKLLDPSYKPDGRFAAGAVCIKFQNTVGWFPLLPSQMNNEMVQQVKEDISFGQGLVLKETKTKNQSRKRGRTAEYDDEVVAKILAQPSKRVRKEKADN